MTTIRIAVIESAATRLLDTERLILGKAHDVINSRPYSFPTLDRVEGYLRDLFVAPDGVAPWFVYRGGNHVALHRVSNSERVLIVEERRK